MVLKRIAVFCGLLLTGIVGILLYKYFNPIDHAFFPKCPVKHVTGLDCPGCGSQRALHFALNGDFSQAFAQNQLIFILLPYILLGFYLQLVPHPTQGELRLRKLLYGSTAIQVVFVIIVLFTIVRNVGYI